MALITKSIEDLIEDYAEALEAEEAEITDLNQGSKFFAQTRATMRLFSELWRVLGEVKRDSNIATATGESLDLLVNTFGLFRKEGNASIGFVIVVPKSPTSKDKLAVGELILVNGGTLSVTSETVLAAPYAIVPVQAVAVGRRWNLSGGTVVEPARKAVDDNFTVMIGDRLNARGQAEGGLYGGQDREDDEELRARFADYIQSLSRATYKAVYQALLGIPGIISVTVVENYPMIGFLSIYLDDGSNNPQLPKNLIAQVEEVLMEWRAAGVGIRIRPLEKITEALTLDVTVDRSVAPSAMEAAIAAEVERVTSLYKQGQSVYPAAVADVAFKFPGVLNATLTSHTELIKVLPHQVFRARSVNVHAHT